MINDSEFEVFCEYMSSSTRADSAAAQYQRRAAALRTLRQAMGKTDSRVARSFGADLPSAVKRQELLTKRAKTVAARMAKEAADARAAWLALCPN